MTGPFDPDRALDHVRRLYGPRRVGTRAERNAARYIVSQFRDFRLERRRERFEVPSAARELSLRIVLAGAIAAILLGASFRHEHPLAAALCWVGVVVLTNGTSRILHWFDPVLRLRRKASTNLLASLPDPSAPVRVVFMAHYDTKSQILPTGLRVALVVIVTVVASLFVALHTGQAAGLIPSLNAQLARLLTWVAVASLGLLLLNMTGNRSPGALDNGTGVGALVELARTFRPGPDHPAEVHWVATGAEEAALDGARELLRRHEAWWRQKPTLLVNLDSIGAGERILLAGDLASLSMAQDAARDLDLDVARLRVIGAGMDHQPFAARGLSALSIMGDVVAVSLHLHSSRDRLERIDADAFDRAVRLAERVAWDWVERHHPVPTLQADPALSAVPS